jgi:hypothetical protein
LCPIHCRGKMVFRYSHASMLKWSVAPTCMKHILWQISSTSTGRQVLPRTREIYRPLEENHGQCHTGLMENLYRWQRFLVTLSLVKDPSTVYGTMLGNQSSSTWHWKHQCLNSCFLLGSVSLFCQWYGGNCQAVYAEWGCINNQIQDHSLKSWNADIPLPSTTMSVDIVCWYSTSYSPLALNLWL